MSKKKYVVHHSYSTFGNSALVTKWHITKEKPFNHIGYHKVILNGFLTPDYYDDALDGRIETGRPLNQDGAHVIGHNSGSIGVCLIGKEKEDITYEQIKSLCDDYARYADTHELFLHNELDTKRTCPGFDKSWLLGRIIEVYGAGWVSVNNIKQKG